MMGKSTLQFLFFVLSLIYLSPASATIFQVTTSGNWQDPIWDQAGLPGINDTVKLNGFNVTLTSSTGNVSIKHLIITNEDCSNNTELIFNAAVVLTISDGLEVYLMDVNRSVSLLLAQGGQLAVGGNTLFHQEIPSFNKALTLKLTEASSIVIDGDFTYDYIDATTSEAAIEILMQGTSEFRVKQNTFLNMSGKEEFDFKIENDAQVFLEGNLAATLSAGKDLNLTAKASSTFQVDGNATLTNSGGSGFVLMFADGGQSKFNIGGNLTLTSTAANQGIAVKTNKNNNVLDVRGDIIMQAETAGTVSVTIKAAGNFYFGGDFVRSSPNGYGNFLMETNATLTLNGTTKVQQLANNDPAANGSDSFTYTNVVLNNALGFMPEDTLVVEDDLDMSMGMIQTDSLHVLIIGDNATITGASETSYINGPLTKIGRTNNAPFVFPIGNDDGFAPLEISKVTTNGFTYTAEYVSEPPPWGLLDPGSEIDHISDAFYWKFNRSSGSPDVDITLNWTASNSTAIAEPDSMLVVGLNDSDVWENFGNEESGGSVGFSGYVSSLDSDPPPWGITVLTLGSLSPINVLPVELSYFQANKLGDEVRLHWETVMEENTSHFSVERSADGYHFSNLKAVAASGNSQHQNHYNLRDGFPVNGINYYRLKMVDFGGRYTYSPTVAVDMSKTPSYKLIPNPVMEEYIWLTGPVSNEPNTLEVFGQSGQLLHTSEISMEEGRLMIELPNIRIQKAGIYLLRISGAWGSKVERLIKLDN